MTPSLFQGISQLKEKIQKKSFSEIFLAVLRRIAGFFWQKKKFLLLKRDLDQPFLKKPQRIDLDIHLCSMEDLALFSDLISPKKMNLFKKRIERGLSLFIGLHQGQVCVYIWGSCESYQEEITGYTIPIGKGELYQFDGSVIPSYRGKGIAFDMQIDFWNEFKAKGVKTTYCYIDPSNRNSLRFHKRLGFEIVKELIFYKILFYKQVKEKEPTSRQL